MIFDAFDVGPVGRSLVPDPNEEHQIRGEESSGTPTRFNTCLPGVIRS